MDKDTLHRFSDRVDNYVKYRPHYPVELFDFLESENILKKNGSVADIGSGTGISAEPLLKRGYTVYGIEPNKEMREAGEKLLLPLTRGTDVQGTPGGFVSVDATSEATTLPDQSIDTVIAGQAFHWFDRDKTKKEFKRILKPNGYVVLMWNDRRTNSTDFLRVYEDFLQMFGTDYKEVNHKNTQDARVFDAFFENGYEEKSFYNYQDVDFAGLKGRVLSSSYMPNEGHRDYEFMIYTLKKIFMRYQENGKVRLDYDTRIYYGKLN